ncbi:MAG: GTPase Era [Desulfobacterales bacterium]
MKNLFADFKSGFAAILGAPNVGKSTLLNRMLGEKISITSRKPQTTRNKIIGVCHLPKAQIVFLDTPGIHAAKDIFNKKMVESALSSIADTDLILLVTDITKPDSVSEKLLLKTLSSTNKPIIALLNKIDRNKTINVESAIDQWEKAYSFTAVIPISAKFGLGIDKLIQTLLKLLPPGPPFFPEDTLTDMPMRFIAAEIIREKIFRLTGEEIPYAVAVTVEKFEEKENLAVIHTVIHVEKESQKGIIIGKKGQMLKKIGQDARTDIEKWMGHQVFLHLFVRVQKNWSKDTKALRRFGYS